MTSTLSLLPTVRTSAISVATTKQPSDKLYNISYLLKPMGDERTLKMTSLVPTNNVPSISTFHQQKTVINAPMYELKTTASQFPLNRLKNKEKKLDMYQSNKKSDRKQQKFSKSETDEKHQFNSAAYCVAYCTIIIIGVTIGGWIGGLFELISGGYNGCNNEYRGNFKCQIKYASLNVTTHCINLFYKKSIPNNSPYICLCRFRNNLQAKYRDCEFLHAKIQ